MGSRDGNASAGGGALGGTDDARPRPGLVNGEIPRYGEIPHVPGRWNFPVKRCFPVGAAPGRPGAGPAVTAAPAGAEVTAGRRAGAREVAFLHQAAARHPPLPGTRRWRGVPGGAPRGARAREGRVPAGLPGPDHQAAPRPQRLHLAQPAHRRTRQATPDHLRPHLTSQQYPTNDCGSRRAVNMAVTSRPSCHIPVTGQKSAGSSPGATLVPIICRSTEIKAR